MRVIHMAAQNASSRILRRTPGPCLCQPYAGCNMLQNLPLVVQRGCVRVRAWWAGLSTKAGKSTWAANAAKASEESRALRCTAQCPCQQHRRAAASALSYNACWVLGSHRASSQEGTAGRGGSRATRCMAGSLNLSLTGRQGSLMAVAAALARCSSSSQPMQSRRHAGAAWLRCSSCCTAAACPCMTTWSDCEKARTSGRDVPAVSHLLVDCLAAWGAWREQHIELGSQHMRQSVCGSRAWMVFRACVCVHVHLGWISAVLPLMTDATRHSAATWQDKRSLQP